MKGIGAILIGALLSISLVVKAPEQSNKTIVWLGDSLTQGSLGDSNDNLENAPYVRLAKLSGRNVEGFGFYGHDTGGVLWMYGAEAWANQTTDPTKTYVFWVGSNNWVQSGGIINDDTDAVIERLNSFVEGYGIEHYIFLGTTARKELRNNINGVPAYKSINSKLEKYYGERYMDVIDVIGENGYGPDEIHLTQEAYDKVADAVYKKLKKLNY